MKDEKLNIWCVIPVYNNSATVKNVAMECRSIMKQVLVIDDASTDLESDFFTALETADIHYIRHERNQGKGGAMLTAIRYLSDLNADYLIGIDADGQHYPADLVKFLDVLHQSESKNGEADLLLAGYRDFNTPNVPG
ncbi:MAG: glycosyltransferase family 2 protein, partial [Victivallaceae bacterium]|nr:glycosyltransferase family 2 protein [Victivallaceae bacterium]